MAITLEKVTYIYQKGTAWKKTALNEVSLEIDRGECVGIVGRSGSGKSTLLQVLNGLLKPQRGRVIIEGTDITSLSAEKLSFIRSKTGLVFQFPEEQFFAPTAYEEVAFALRNLGLKEAKVVKRVKEAMQKVGLDYEKYKGRFPSTLSSGEKRRLGLATILALEPDYLLLDEPTAALDYEGREKIYGIIKEINQHSHTAVVMVGHNLEHMVNICSRIIVLDEGRIALDLRVEELAAYGDELTRLGIYLPFHHQVIYHLQNRGLKINFPVRTRQEAAQEIKKLFPMLETRSQS